METLQDMADRGYLEEGSYLRGCNRAKRAREIREDIEKGKFLARIERGIDVTVLRDHRARRREMLKDLENNLEEEINWLKKRGQEEEIKAVLAEQIKAVLAAYGITGSSSSRFSGDNAAEDIARFVRAMINRYYSEL